MSETAAQEALEQHLITLANRPTTVWVNKQGEGVPRLELNHGPVANTALTHRGGGQSALLSQIDIVVAAGTGADAGAGNDKAGMRTYAQAVIDHFPFNFKLAGAKVLARPSMSGMRKDGEEFRVSVTIRYKLNE